MVRLSVNVDVLGGLESDTQGGVHIVILERLHFVALVVLIRLGGVNPSGRAGVTHTVDER